VEVNWKVSAITVVMDANVLVPAALCDFLLRAAAKDIYRLIWTEDILEEVRRTLINDLGKSEMLANKRIEAMKAAFPEALVTQHIPLISAMTNDPKDRHVLAAAVVSGATIIVTSNLVDFPPESLLPFSLEALSPDHFVSDLLALDRELVSETLTQQAAALRNPPKTVEDILDELARIVPVFVARYRA
jgi:predicted nucleic acid-binding protein